MWGLGLALYKYIQLNKSLGWMVYKIQPNLCKYYLNIFLYVIFYSILFLLLYYISIKVLDSEFVLLLFIVSFNLYLHQNMTQNIQ